MTSTDRWHSRLREFLPGFALAHPVLGQVGGDAAAVLHGSTTFGVDDAHSDLDVWLLLSDAALVELDARSATRFFEFELDGKPGHCNAEALDGFARRISSCEMPLLAELRTARVLSDESGAVQALLDVARRPMRDDVRLAWFRYHYVEHRSEQKGTQNAIERGEPHALLQFAPRSIAHALRAALILDGEPYPYDKWLAWSARRHAAGARVEAEASRLFDRLASDALRRPGPEDGHPVRASMLEVRGALVEEARRHGIDEPWLDRWWLDLAQARRGIRELTWSGGVA